MRLREKRKGTLVLNVVSLIDVLFLLLLFFVVSTTFLSSPAIQLELPKAQNAEVVRESPVVVYIDANGGIFVNDEPVDMALLPAALQGKLAVQEDKAVILKADSRVSHGTVVEVMDVVKSAGAHRLVVATKPNE
jgi:biopolymer transport protein ExbD